ncbi:50S ribosomal protein L17 [Lunatibacter salilacus]|uniref:50S ribosomal protein L17 n=1 Tax=Lunatibacter salilacus TaxID=2483804 RepID=UPI00131AB4E8|nr:50S ribosomal protein L17 [Lunatibacter salilacus]
MRHGKKFNHLGRTAPHRKAMLSNMACSLFLHKRISTTVAKAKELRKYVEPFITRAKEDTTHNRRVVFSYLQNKDAIKILFGEVVEKVGSRPGGYTRIIKTGFRLGDNAEMSIIELVDYNELMLKDAKPAKKSTRRRSRRGAGAAASTDATSTAEVVDEPTDKASKADQPSAEVVEDSTDETAKTDQPSAEGEDQTDAKDEKKAE